MQNTHAKRTTGDQNRNRAAVSRIPRTMPELQRVLDTFRVHKEENQKSRSGNFTLLDQRNRRDVTSILTSFSKSLKTATWCNATSLPTPGE